MSEIEYSVIVPVYNVEKVLERCIKSILQQTIKNFELILIDDGSTDKSGMICDEYQKKDARIKVIHKKNEGVSKARNTGLDIAVGKYIVFVDSDDYVESKYLENYGDENEDLVITGMWLCKENLSIEKIFTMENNYLDMNDENSVVHILKNWYALPPCAKRFKKDIISENRILFPEECCYGEDAIFVAKYLKVINDVLLSNKIAYRYCMYDHPTLSKINDGERFEKYDYILSSIYQVFKKDKVINQFILEKYWWIAEQEIENVYNDISKNSKEKAEIVISYIRTPLSKICLESNVTNHVRSIKKKIYKKMNKNILAVWIFLYTKIWENLKKRRR